MDISIDLTAASNTRIFRLNRMRDKLGPELKLRVVQEAYLRKLQKNFVKDPAYYSPDGLWNKILGKSTNAGQASNDYAEPIGRFWDWVANDSSVKLNATTAESRYSTNPL